MLSGPDAEYTVPLPEPGDPMRVIIRSYTKEHSAEHQAQALIGTGANDPQKMAPNASRETLDHSAM